MSQIAQLRADASRLYTRETPLTGRHKAHKQDLREIASSARPLEKASKLARQRKIEKADTQIEGMLKELQGSKRKRYEYNQHAVVAIDGLLNGLLDPQTQRPIWRKMLEKTRNGNLSKEEFYAGARAILIQHHMYDPVTMAA